MEIRRKKDFMNYEYKPSGVCATKFNFKIKNNIIKDIRAIGGCPGNLLGIRALCIDKDIDEVISKLKNIKCGLKSTSCPDQIAKALEHYKKETE